MAPARSRLDRAEVVAVLVLVLATVWRVWSLLPRDTLARSALKNSIVLALVGIVVVSFVRRRVGLDGFGLASPGAGWGRAAGFTALAAALLVALGTALGTSAFSQARVVWLADYVPGLIGQQLLLQTFLNDRLFQLSGAARVRDRTRFAVGVSTLAFVSMHAPVFA